MNPGPQDSGNRDDEARPARGRDSGSEANPRGDRPGNSGASRPDRGPSRGDRDRGGYSGGGDRGGFRGW
ncbi:hypothetical protein [Actinoplanes sp. N902-109]|uniref:hypothetical protein n=1 Tax=Actinoplanes sp. (strain N902-109) TaxID=649831 RepID=UPI000329487F|nr:hypothetical protein [Actinoplanes sp. N902-109]AGL19335.1 hypothetical protein L083_5825 [Actinoplanes sp. N902-109]